MSLSMRAANECGRSLHPVGALRSSLGRGTRQDGVPQGGEHLGQVRVAHRLAAALDSSMSRDGPS